MGLSSSPATPPAGPTRLEMDKDASMQSMMRELVELRQRNTELEESHRAAVGARKAAVDRVRELEDVLSLNEGIFDSLERQISLLEKQNALLQRKEAELDALRAEMAEHPVCESDLLHRYNQLVEVFDLIKDTLSCAVCYEPYKKDEAVSLMCGHTFCRSCYSSWEQRSIEAFKLSPVAGQYLGPDCPECRSADVRRGRIRIWSLEEVVRLVDRAQREIAKNPYVPALGGVRPKPGSEPELVTREDRRVDAAEPDDEGHGTAQHPPTPASAGTPVPAAPAEFASPRDQPLEAIELPAAEEPEVVSISTPDPADGAEAYEGDVDVRTHTAEPSASPLNASTTSAHPMPTDPPREEASGGLDPASESTCPLRMDSNASGGGSGGALADPTISIIDDTLPQRPLDAHARAREQARLRALEDEARAALDAQRAREAEEEREAREAREQVLSERRRTPYLQVFR